MPRAGKSQDVRPAPRLRRAYYDCRFGQLHLHNAIPAGGGFDELTPLICLPDAGETGQVFLPLLGDLGIQRSVYAPDLPGTGGSDPAPGQLTQDAAFHAIADFVDNMRIRSFDLLARGAASAVALQLLDRRGAAVRRVILVDPPAGARGSARVSLLAAAQAQPGRLVELLAP